MLELAFDRLKRLFNASIRTLREDGFIGFIRKVISFFVSFDVYYVYERSTRDAGKIKLLPEVRKYKVKIIRSLQELDELEKQGYDLTMRDLKIGVKSGAMPFCIFYGKKMVHVTWALTSEKAKKEIDRAPVKINFQNGEATTGGSFTDPLHRGKGLLSYAYFYILPYLAKHGFKKIKFTIRIDNNASQKGAKRFDPKLVSKGRYLKILWLNLWRDITLK